MRSKEGEKDKFFLKLCCLSLAKQNLSSLFGKMATDSFKRELREFSWKIRADKYLLNAGKYLLDTLEAFTNFDYHTICEFEDFLCQNNICANVTK